VAVVVGALACNACGSASRAAEAPPRRDDLHGTLTVAAAASLSGVFTTLGERFEAAHPGVRVLFDFGSSGVLETQIAHGAPADVFASADAAVMEEARRAGVIEGPIAVFARNTLELVVRPGNPLRIRSLADLRRASVGALCAERAPCGAAAQEVLARAGVELATSKVSRGQDVKATVRQVTFGDADAAIVYVTDARTAGTHGEAVPIPAAQNLVTDDPIAVVAGSSHAPLARAWIAHLRGPVGRSVLHAAGFVSAR
jgi:molybdate transport system substrate-binding protein